MEQKNYTLDCKWVGAVNSENIKEMAKVMVWNCCPCTYKDDEVTAVASASIGMDGKPYTMWVIIGGKHYNYTLNSKRVSEKMGKEIVDNILKAVAEHKEDKEKMDTKKIAKAMAECFCSKETTEVGDYKFVFAWESGSTRKIIVYKKNDTIEGIETIGGTMEEVVANTILHREKLEKNCEEKFGWMVLKNWARRSEYEGTDLYEYLSSKCVEEGISIDILDRHSDDIIE